MLTNQFLGWRTFTRYLRIAELPTHDQALGERSALYDLRQPECAGRSPFPQARRFQVFRICCTRWRIKPCRNAMLLHDHPNRFRDPSDPDAPAVRSEAESE